MHTFRCLRQGVGRRCPLHRPAGGPPPRFATLRRGGKTRAARDFYPPATHSELKETKAPEQSSPAKRSVAGEGDRPQGGGGGLPRSGLIHRMRVPFSKCVHPIAEDGEGSWSDSCGSAFHLESCSR